MGNERQARLDKARKKATEDQDSFTNQLRSFFGKEKLPKANVLDVGFAGSRLKKKPK